MSDIEWGCCSPCSGKWIAIQAVVNWYGWWGFLSEYGQSGACRSGCIYATESTNKKYLQRTINMTWEVHNAVTEWHWNGAAWIADDGVKCDQAASEKATFTYNKQKGLIIVTGCESSYVDTVPPAPWAHGCSTCDATGEGVAPFVVPPPAQFRGLDYACGKYINGASSTAYTQAEFIDAWIGGGPRVLTFDTVTDTHIGFHVTLSQDYENLTEPAPPGPGDPLVVCRSSHASAKADVTVDLSNPYTYADLDADCRNLLLLRPLMAETWRPYDEILPPTCQDGIPLIQYKVCGVGDQAYPTWGLPTCDYVPDPSCTGEIIGLRGAADNFSPGPIAWGANASFNGYSLTMQKWGMRQGSYLPFGWQIGNSKTWNYMFQQWEHDFCTNVVTYTCENNTGAKDFIMVVSPNPEVSLPEGRTHPFQTPGPATVGEITNGSIWQAVCRDSAPDQIDPDNACGDPYVYHDWDNPVEPDCSCNCVTGTEPSCNAPTPGYCPCNAGEWCILPDNYPPLPP